MKTEIELTESDIERFKGERSKYEDEAKTQGYLAGTRWAKHRAKYGELLVLHRKNEDAGGINWPDTMLEFFQLIHGDNGRSEWADWIPDNEKYLAFVDDADFAVAFTEGALDAFVELERVA